MSMYGHLSARALVELVLAKCEGETALSKTTNGIGYGIGCLLPPEVAGAWDQIGSIGLVYEREYEQYAQWFADTQLAILDIIQDSHNSSGNLEAFLSDLRSLRDLYRHLETFIP